MDQETDITCNHCGYEFVDHWDDEEEDIDDLVMCPNCGDMT